jgi:hypothetical protein
MQCLLCWIKEESSMEMSSFLSVNQLKCVTGDVWGWGKGLSGVVKKGQLILSIGPVWALGSHPCTKGY